MKIRKSRFQEFISSFEKFVMSNQAIYLLLVFIFSLVVVIARRPDAFSYPQWWAEDGKHWFGQAYQEGWLKSLSLPYAGSSQLAMRLTGSLSLLLPLSLVPAFFTTIAVIAQILPVILINTRRFRSIFQSLGTRLLLSFCYLTLPNSFETHANLTNIGWHLSIVCFLILIAPMTKNKLWQFFDIVMLVVGCLTGPFTFILLIIAVTMFIKLRTHKVRLLNLVVVITSCVYQFMILITSSSGRETGLQAVGASTETFIKIAGQRIAGPTLFGDSFGLNIAHNEYLIIFLFFIVCGVVAYALIRSISYLKLFVVFCFLVFFASLASPAMGATWQNILVFFNDRYFLLPTLALLSVLVFMTKEKNVIFRYFAICYLLVFSFVAVPRSFSYKKRPDLSFQSYVNKFYDTKKGDTLCIPVNPDNGWLTCIEKK